MKTFSELMEGLAGSDRGGKPDEKGSEPKDLKSGEYVDSGQIGSKGAGSQAQHNVGLDTSKKINYKGGNPPIVGFKKHQKTYMRGTPGSPSSEMMVGNQSAKSITDQGKDVKRSYVKYND